ncbi:MAG: phenylacetate--CoA ligase family protein [Chloroflexi bacterium]|nr:phenylacetate--CoA ligase family protein [Chloroflexota bacterium]
MFDDEHETLARDALAAHQLRRARAMLAEVLASNPFYRRHFGGCAHVVDWDSFRTLPFTAKADIAQDQARTPLFGTNLTYSIEAYTRLHQTTGTTGRAPIRWLDTPTSWAWWLRCWGHVYRAAGVRPGDRVFFPFSFGPFIGFWSAYEAAGLIGALTIPGGGMSTEQRLRAILDTGVTVVCCTPTYALRLAESADQLGLDLRSSEVRVLIHAGEPGASIPQVRDRVEQAWGAHCVDHTGMTEIGATGFSCPARRGVHLIESEFIAEVVDPSTGAPVRPATAGELVLTNLGRIGTPLIRYRTGDLVRLETGPCACGRTFARLDGGILGRVDDMVVVRGMNLFPSAIEGVVREFPEVVEFRIELSRARSMVEARVLIEPRPDCSDADAMALAARVAGRLHERLLLRLPCEPAPVGSLPRFELKARRLVWT